MGRDAWQFLREHGYLTNTKSIESASELLDCVYCVWESRGSLVCLSPRF